MNSISTNPFETDDSDADFSSPVTGVKHFRKKRRAPLPPTQANVITLNLYALAGFFDSRYARFFFA